MRALTRRVAADPTGAMLLVGPAGSANEVQITTTCPHSGLLTHVYLDGLAERHATGVVLAHHAATGGCDCFQRAWPDYRAPGWPEELTDFAAHLWPGGAGNEAAIGSEFAALFSPMDDWGD